MPPTTPLATRCMTSCLLCRVSPPPGAEPVHPPSWQPIDAASGIHTCPIPTSAANSAMVIEGIKTCASNSSPEGMTQQAASECMGYRQGCEMYVLLQVCIMCVNRPLSASQAHQAAPVLAGASLDPVRAAAAAHLAPERQQLMHAHPHLLSGKIASMRTGVWHSASSSHRRLAGEPCLNIWTHIA